MKDSKYEEALERARAGKPIDEVFPELKESEDERIRKDIIGGLMWQRDNLKSEGPHDNNLILPGFCLTVGEHLSYLEKQKDSKVVKFDHDKEQQPAEWSDEDEEWYMYLLGELNASIKDYCGAAEKDIKEAIRWFKSRYKSLRPQQKQEWSEEEEKDIQEASNYLRDYANNCVQGGNSKLYIQSLADRIESLRHKPHWKPSEEQMAALKHFIGPSIEGAIVAELYDDLQKRL